MIFTYYYFVVYFSRCTQNKIIYKFPVNCDVASFASYAEFTAIGHNVFRNSAHILLNKEIYARNFFHKIEGSTGIKILTF